MEGKGGKRQKYGREELEMVRKKGQIKGKGDKVLTWLIRQVGCRNTVTQQTSVRLKDTAADRHLLSRQGQFLGGGRRHGARGFRRDAAEGRGLNLRLLFLCALRTLQALGWGRQAVGAFAWRRGSLSHRCAFGADGILLKQKTVRWLQIW